MLGITTPNMVAAASNSGILGSLPVGGLSVERTKDLITKTKQLTDKPFAVNLFTHKIPNINDIDRNNYTKMQQFIEEECKGSGILTGQVPLTLEELYSQLYTYKNQIQVLIDEQIPIVSFTFGNLDSESIERLKSRNTVLIGTATNIDEALLLENTKIDMIVAQGVESGGHRGTFIFQDDGTALPPEIGLLQLLESIRSRGIIDRGIPIIASGGLYDAETIEKSFSMGSSAVQLGSIFLASDESSAIPSYKNLLPNSKDCTELTRSYSGRWARGIKNQFMDDLSRRGDNLKIPAYPIQNSLTTPMRSGSQKLDNNQFTNLWSGVFGYKAKKLPCSDIINSIVLDCKSKNLF
eukprot:gene5703-7097_t